MFLFSATPADTSQAESGFLANIVVTWIHPDYAQMPADVQYEVLHQCDHVIRKCAHALEYLLLGILVQVALNATRLRGSKQSSHARPSLIAATSLAICVLYATTDEIHQLFVPGRAGMISDVGIDACGAIVGVLIAWAIITAVKKRRTAA